MHLLDDFAGGQCSLGWGTPLSLLTLGLAFISSYSCQYTFSQVALELHFYAQKAFVLRFLPKKKKDFKIVHFRSSQLRDVTNCSIVGGSWRPDNVILYIYLWFV
jgi:hypothetical protein